MRLPRRNHICGERSLHGLWASKERGEEFEEFKGFKEFELLGNPGEQILSDAIPRSSGSEANRAGCQRTRAVARER
jgi:hypothetical protein